MNAFEAGREAGRASRLDALNKERVPRVAILGPAQQQRRAYEQAYAQELECEEREQLERDLRDTLRQQQEMRQEQLRRQEAERERMRRQEQQDCVIL